MSEVIIDAGNNLIELVGCEYRGELVRCKECIDFVYDEQYKCYGCANDNGLMGEIKPDDFCSYGEREGE